jgi:hypothetical protein
MANRYGYNQRNRKRKFIALGHDCFDSPAFRYLSGDSVKVYLLIIRRYNGHNNGKIGLELSEAASCLCLSESKVLDGLAELQEHGLVEKLSSEWALTDRSLDVQVADAGDRKVGWRSWTPTGTDLGGGAA